MVISKDEIERTMATRGTGVENVEFKREISFNSPEADNASLKIPVRKEGKCVCEWLVSVPNELGLENRNNILCDYFFSHCTFSYSLSFIITVEITWTAFSMHHLLVLHSRGSSDNVWTSVLLQLHRRKRQS